MLTSKISVGWSAAQKVSLLLSHIKDDSYTPQKLSIKAGTSKQDLTEVRNASLATICVLRRRWLTKICETSQVMMVQFEKPEGWQTIDLRDAIADDAEGDERYV